MQDVAKRGSQDQKDWPRFLADAVWSYNCQIHSATGYSPMFLMMGRDPVNNIDMALRTEEELRKDLKGVKAAQRDQLVDRMMRLQKATREVRQRQEEHLERMSRYYNKDRRRPSCFRE